MKNVMKQLFFGIGLSLTMSQDVFAWAMCVINQVNSATGIADTNRGNSLHPVITIPGHSDFDLEKKGDWVCTKDTNGTAEIGFTGDAYGIPPYAVGKIAYTANRTDKYHEYIEVHCGQNVRFWYDNGEWNSEAYPWKDWQNLFTCN